MTTTLTPGVQVGMRSHLDVEKTRRDFPALHQKVYGKPLVYLDNAATSQKPQVVIDTVARYYTIENSNIHRGVHYLSERATRAYVDARMKVTEFINARDTDEPLLRQPPVAGAPLLDEMHLLTPSGTHLCHGFGAFRWMAWRLPPCWLIAPLLYLPGVPWLGQRIYLWIARNRYHLVPCRHGVCDIQQKQ